MLSLLRITFLVTLLTMTTLVVHGQEDLITDNQVLYDAGELLQELFYDAMESSFVNSTGNNHERGYLRRDLQTTTPVCRATRPTGNMFVCGGWAGGNDDPCRNSQATCAGLTYGCSCSGSSETTCSYCQLRGANAILCQQSGSSTTYRDLSGTVLTCSCEYIGNGQVRQNCRQPSPMPVPLPTLAPVSVRAPSAPIPSPGIPIGVPTAQPPQAAPVNTQVSCRATNPFNVNLGIGSSCSTLQNYPCNCNGSGETSCSYCQVRTFNAVICQVTGSDITFLDPTGTMKTCHCEYRGNGQAQQYCYSVVGSAGAPTNPAPVWTPTSQRAPTGSPPVAAPVVRPVPVPVPAVPAPPKQGKKNNKRA